MKRKYSQLIELDEFEVAVENEAERALWKLIEERTRYWPREWKHSLLEGLKKQWEEERTR